jgi:hypothetical protein
METTTVKSKFRIEYWITWFVSLIAGSLIATAFFYNAFHSRWIYYTNGTFWMGCMTAILCLSGLFTFLNSGLRRLTVSESGIEVKYLFKKKVFHVKHDDIIGLSIRRLRSKYSDGYHEISLKRMFGSPLTFDEGMYRNYTEIKNAIIMYRKSED